MHSRINRTGSFIRHRVLYLLTQYASQYDNVHGVEYNKKLLQIAQQNLKKHNLLEEAKSVHCNVEDLPYPNDYFDTVIVTWHQNGNDREKC
jgi:ubiquinone/menaquinone biosynthesis C-methylase UbiE